MFFFLFFFHLEREILSVDEGETLGDQGVVGDRVDSLAELLLAVGHNLIGELLERLQPVDRVLELGVYPLQLYELGLVDVFAHAATYVVEAVCSRSYVARGGFHLFQMLSIHIKKTFDVACVLSMTILLYLFFQSNCLRIKYFSLK